ncbi:TctA family transporter [Variovorax sp. HW608]|uniref:tripartite tricarboxylate transporter permease n=1 Tax=Variovorax sp. HW608 TaxID=1034889 RepID=UPI00081FFB4C|nr:tripartite tricarboxylate transporter permease [Variovorax sp. HW608]SCK41181.1 TctA family transporter [Variovorax sp. HW608]
MDALNNLWQGFGVALLPNNLMWSFIGVFMGNLIGVLPGIGPLAAISLLLPVTYSLDPTAALMMLAGIYYGAQYGGATTSILLNLPGVASHAVTCLDGHPMAKQGRGGAALFMAMLASFIGASIGIALMTFFSPLLVDVAFRFGPAEYFAMMLLGLLAASTLAKGSPLKGIAMVLVGLILGVVGTDVNSGVARFALDIPELTDGLALVALAMGLFGIADTLANVNRIGTGAVETKVTLRSLRLAKGEMKRSWMPILRGTAIGSFFGILPGTGSTIASFISYATEKKVSRHPEQFGHGAIEGIAGPEASNNAAAQTAFIPTMSLGIPGDAVMALMLGALMIHNIQPGPQLISEHPLIFWGLIASFWVGNLLLLVLNIPLIGMWVRLLTVPYRIIYPCVLFFICIGVYSGNNNLFDVGVVLAIGVGGYFTTRLGFEPAPVLLGFVLGPMVEENFRRALLLSRGDPGIFVTRPISAAFVLACCLMLAGVAYTRLRKGRSAQRAAG